MQNDKSKLKIRIVKFQPKYIDEVMVLIDKSFNEFIAPQFTKEAAEKYRSWVQSGRKKEEVINSEIKLMFLENDKIIGFISGDRNKIGNLFIKKKFQKSGIGSRLLEDYEERSKALGGVSLKLKALSSVIPFYAKNGYRKSTGLRARNGVPAQPMKKALK